MRFLPKIRSFVRCPAASETDLSCWEMVYLVPVFIFVMRKGKDRKIRLFPKEIEYLKIWKRHMEL